MQKGVPHRGMGVTLTASASCTALFRIPKAACIEPTKGRDYKALPSGKPAAKTLHKWKNGRLKGASVDIFSHPVFIPL